MSSQLKWVALKIDGYCLVMVFNLSVSVTNVCLRQMPFNVPYCPLFQLTDLVFIFMCV